MQLDAAALACFGVSMVNRRDTWPRCTYIYFHSGGGGHASAVFTASARKKKAKLAKGLPQGHNTLIYYNNGSPRTVFHFNFLPVLILLFEFQTITTTTKRFFFSFILQRTARSRVIVADDPLVHLRASRCPANLFIKFFGQLQVRRSPLEGDGPPRVP